MSMSDRSADVCYSDLAGVRQRLKEGGKFFGCVDQSRAVVLQLPLGKAEHDREVGCGATAHLRYDFGRKGNTPGDIAAVPVVSSIGLRPDELLEQIAVPAVHCDAITAQIIGGLLSLGARSDTVIDIPAGPLFPQQR